MPAPAVYVIAIVGTVGVAIAFKEVLSTPFLFTLLNYTKVIRQFIYPHLAPRIDRWKAEFQAARKRRAESAVAEVALTQRGVGKDGHQNQEGDDSHSDLSDVGLGKGSSSLRPQVHPYLKNGLLIRRRSGSSETTPSNPGDVELDWITSTATETASQQQDLRLRKNNGSLNEVPLFHSLFGWSFHFSLFSTQMKSSHDFELKKTTATHAFMDEVGLLFLVRLSY